MTDVGELVAQTQAAPDPYAIYDALRAVGRVLWMDNPGRWVVTGHAAALSVLRDERFSSDRGRWDEYVPPEGADELSGGMFTMDPPDHTRLRKLVSQAFTARVVERLRPRVDSLVVELLDAMDDRSEVDLMEAFAGPLPAVVLAEMLGIPAADQGLFRRWTVDFIESVDPVSHALLDEKGLTARAELEAYLTDVISERRRSPRVDLISEMVAAEDAGDRLSARELLEMSILLTVAGLETTANLIGNGTYALIGDPDQADLLRRDPAVEATAIEELLRFDSPIQMSGRVPIVDVEVEGVTLRKGQMVAVLGGAANRDPDVFADPGRLDLTRRPNNHIAFGRGMHFCLGAPLARLEGLIAVPALVRRFPAMRLAGTPVWRQNFHVRGFAELPVALK